jgi:hypothetical protein
MQNVLKMNIEKVKRMTQLVNKWCGQCGLVFKADIHAAYCIQCGKRSLDYICTCGRKHVGGIPCHCKPQEQIHNVDVRNQYNTINLRGVTIEQYTGKK